jgi:hypothetical protein
VLITLCVFAVPSSTPASPLTDCASGNAGQQVEVLRHRDAADSSSTTGTDASVPEKLSHAADVDDDVVSQA